MRNKGSSAKEAILAQAALPDLSELTAEDQAKVVKMQASARGYLARKQVLGMKSGATPDIDSMPELPDLAAFDEQDQQKILRIQAAARGHITRKVGGMRNRGLL